jgi:hypothetical protein
MSCSPLMKGVLALCVPFSFPTPARAQLELGPEEILQSGGLDIEMPSESAATCVDWDEDGRQDLVVSNGYNSVATKVRVFLNVGTASAPQFNGFFFVQANGLDLHEPPSG